jgi:hypothetical protein
MEGKMIPKKREDYQNVEGAGRPFEMNERYYVEKNDAERNRPIVIHLGELNGQTTSKGMPKNFHTKKGRVLNSFTKYWSPAEALANQEDSFDIE